MILTVIVVFMFIADAALAFYQYTIIEKVATICTNNRGENSQISILRDANFEHPVHLTLL